MAKCSRRNPSSAFPCRTPGGCAVGVSPRSTMIMTAGSIWWPWEKISRAKGGSFCCATKARKVFAMLPQETGLDKIALRNPRSVIAFDCDGDGSADLLITQNNLPPMLLKNARRKQERMDRAGLQGAIGSKEWDWGCGEAFCRLQQQRWEVQGASGYLGQGPPEILAGLGASEGRCSPPGVADGILQNELQVPGGRRNLIPDSIPATPLIRFVEKARSAVLMDLRFVNVDSGPLARQAGTC